MIVDPAGVDEDGVRVEEPLRGVDLILQSAGKKVQLCFPLLDFSFFVPHRTISDMWRKKDE